MRYHLYGHTEVNRSVLHVAYALGGHVPALSSSRPLTGGYCSYAACEQTETSNNNRTGFRNISWDCE
jgi:hypothetical protein